MTRANRAAAAATLAILCAAAGSAAGGTSRTEVLDRARTYAFYPWRAAADNLDAPCDPEYQTAFTEGDFLGVAYKWGGFDSLFQFSEKLADGYGAGTTTYDQVFSCMTGVDCSGFVSRAWNTSQKYGTSTLEQISHHIAASQLLPGDVFNNAGHHCAMYSHTLASGEPYLIEAVYFNTHLNATGGWSYVDGFTTIRYDDITGTEADVPVGTLDHPIEVGSLPFSDARDTRQAPSDSLDGCGAAPGSSESGGEFVYRVEVTHPGMLTASVSDDAGADIDVHLYGSWNTSDCTARGDTTLTAPVDCGTYYVVADTFRSGGVDQAGAYDITITLSPAGGACGGGAPGYDPLGGPGDACAYPDHEALPFCNSTLGADTCIYTTGDEPESFCSRACAAGDACDDMPGGGCCQDIGDGELYCMTGDFCPPPPGGGDDGDDGDQVGGADGGPGGGGSGGDGSGGGSGGGGSGGGDSTGGCAVASTGASGPAALLVLLAWGWALRRRSEIRRRRFHRGIAGGMLRRMRTLATPILSTVVAVLLAACSSHTTDGASGDGDGDGAGVDGGAGAPDAAAQPLRFVALGDTGTGLPAQGEVAEAVRATCAAEGCDFALLLGDNLYTDGADSVDDPVWQELFEQPYADIDLPFYAVLGNHDYGGKLLGFHQGGLGNEFDRGPVEVAYSGVSSKWRMPDTHYVLRFGSVGIVALDTNSMMWNNVDNGDQADWWPGALAEASGDATWVIAAGHHPYRSNGAHGNAGTYGVIEELPDLDIPLSQINGAKIRDFFDEHVCGNVDVYLCGHDHNRQWLDESARCGGTELIVDGSAGKVTAFQDTADNVARWQDDTTEGFLYVVVDGDTFTGRFIDKTGAVAYEYTLTK